MGEGVVGMLGVCVCDIRYHPKGENYNYQTLPERSRTNDLLQWRCTQTSLCMSKDPLGVSTYLLDLQLWTQFFIGYFDQSVTCTSEQCKFSVGGGCAVGEHTRKTSNIHGWGEGASQWFKGLIFRKPLEQKFNHMTTKRCKTLMIYEPGLWLLA